MARRLARRESQQRASEVGIGQVVEPVGDRNVVDVQTAQGHWNGKPELHRIPSRHCLDDSRLLLQPRTDEGCGRMLAKVTGKVPEVVEVPWVPSHEVVEEPSPHRRVLEANAFGIEPGLWREAHAGRFCEGLTFLLVESGEHVTAAARFNRIDDLWDLVV